MTYNLVPYITAKMIFTESSASHIMTRFQSQYSENATFTLTLE